MTGQPQRLATVSAMTECVIVRIAKADITRVIHEEPAFAELFIAHLLARNSRVEEDLVDQPFSSSEKRLARPFCFWPILAGLSIMPKSAERHGR